MPFCKRGFTLIELLVVVAIIGLLAAIIMVSLDDARNRGNDAGIRRELVEARTQAELFYAANGNRYVASPGTASDVCSPLAEGSVTDGIKGLYTQFKTAADIAGVSGSNIQTSRTQAGGNGKATCHACPAGIPAGSCGGLNSNAWAIEVPLKDNLGASGADFWCIDSSGFNARNDNGSRLSSGDARCL